MVNGGDMSGGHFGGLPYQMRDAADEIEYQAVVLHGQGAGLDTAEKFMEAARTLRKAAWMLNRVDYLLEGDDGEGSFHEAWVNESVKDMLEEANAKRERRARRQ
jgi:hypothetical protein